MIVPAGNSKALAARQRESADASCGEWACAASVRYRRKWRRFPAKSQEGWPNTTQYHQPVRETNRTATSPSYASRRLPTPSIQQCSQRSRVTTRASNYQSAIGAFIFAGIYLYPLTVIRGAASLGGESRRSALWISDYRTGGAALGPVADVHRATAHTFPNRIWPTSRRPVSVCAGD